MINGLNLFILHLITLSPISTASDLRPQSLSLSLIAISYLCLSLSKNVLCISLSFSISDSQSQILKTWNHFTKSPSLTRMLSASHSLISTVPSPISYEISRLKSSSVFNLHPLKACIFGLLNNEQTTLSNS